MLNLHYLRDDELRIFMNFLQKSDDLVGWTTML
jgi:hypothetical protein